MKFSIAALAMAVVAVTAAAVSPVSAQTRSEEQRDNAVRASGNARMGSTRAPRAPRLTPEQTKANAQEQATQAGTGCQVTEAKLLGITAIQTSIYEVACSAGPGYIIETKTPPLATDCVLIAHTAAAARAADPQAPVPPQCTIPANQDTQRFLKEYAQQAEVPCTVDEVSVVGRANDNAIVYEAGCSGEQGYWIKKVNDAWSKTPCIQVVAENATCRYTTTGEIAASVKKWLAGSDAASCNVTEARLMGKNANGIFYEAKCDGADGVIARLNAENVVQQIYPCATAQQIGGGCKLTTAPAVAAAPAGGRP